MAQKGHGKLWGVSPLYFSRRLTDRVFRGCRLITPPSLPPSTKPRFLGQKGHCGLAGRCGVVCRSLVRVPDCIFLRPTTWVRDQSCFMLSCFHAHVHAGSTPDRSRDLAGDQKPAEKTEWTVSGEVRETDLFPSCHLSCHRTGYHSPPLSLVKRGKGEISSEPSRGISEYLSVSQSLSGGHSATISSDGGGRVGGRAIPPRACEPPGCRKLVRAVWRSRFSRWAGHSGSILERKAEQRSSGATEFWKFTLFTPFTPFTPPVVSR